MATTSASSPSIDPSSRIPLLASATANAASSALTYALWRPQMQTYLMRQSIEERDYTEALPRWKEMIAAVETDARDQEKAAIELLLAGTQKKAVTGGASSPSADGASKAADSATDSAAQKEAKRAVSALIARSRKAFGILYAALPTDLRTLVNDVPQGYAFGLWMFLEKKFRNTEQDNVAALWKDFATLSQTVDESFDEYKARVDSVVELLVHAKEQPPTGLYMTLLVWNLQPRYATAVLTLKTGDRLKDPAKVDWPYVVEYMNQFERSQLGLGDAESASEKAMAARARVPSHKVSTQSGSRPLSEIECFNCHEKGHYRSTCPKPKVKSYKGKRQDGATKKAQGTASAWSKNSSEDESDSAAPKKAGERANLARGANRYDALSSEDEEDQAPLKPERSYAIALTSGSTKEVSAPRTAKVSESRPTKSLDTALRTTAKAVDSAATVSTTCSRDTLVNVRRCTPMPIRMADGSTLSAMYKGDMPMRLRVSGMDKHVKVIINDVYYHERFDANLLSWGSMRRNGWEMHSTKNGTYLLTPGGKRVDANTRSDLTILEDQVLERVYGLGGVVAVTAKEVLQLHRRLGHVSWSRLVEMCKGGATIGVPDVSNMSTSELAKAEKAVKECSACESSKAHRKALGHQGLDKGTRAGEVLHMDTFYAVTRDLTTGKKKTEYCLLAADAYSEWRWCDPRSSLAELPQAAIDIMQHSHTLTGRYPRLVITDLGSEFENKTTKEFARKNGIQIQPSPARAKELNGLAEKNVDTTKNHVRAMLCGAGMPEELGWKYGTQHFVYMWNRTHIGRRTGVTPFQSMTGRESSVLNAGEFGCDVYVHQHRSLRDTTFGPKAEPAIYLGHSGRQNCPIVRMLSSGKIILSKDVHFREGSFKHLRAALNGSPEDIKPVDLSVDSEVAGDSESAENEVPQSERKYAESDLDHDDITANRDEPVRYQLKSITDSRVDGGVKQYRCKWTGYSGATWEPAATIAEDAPDAARKYEAFIAARAQAVAAATRSQSRTNLKAPMPVPVQLQVGNASSETQSNSDVDDDESDIQVAAAYAARCL
jgi:hypothetical protein